MYQQQPFGTCKVKDGLYIGDEFAAKDLEFIVANKVGYIVNCSSDKLENLFEGVGVMYFSFQWPEASPELIADISFIDHVFEFIEESVQNGESCLITSQHGQSRACSMVTIYLMKKFKWTLYKTLEYLNSRRSDLEIKTSFFQVLSQVEKMIKTDKFTNQWEISQRFNSPEEQIVFNTFHNAKTQLIDPLYTQQDEFNKCLSKSCIPFITWSENPNTKKHNLNQIKSILKGHKGQIQKELKDKDVGRKTTMKSFSLNKENQPDIPQIKKVQVPVKNIRSTSNPKPKPPANKKQTTSNKSLNQVVIPQKILRPKMPNFDLL